MGDISVYVLKPFPFSRNGVEEQFAAAGQTMPIPERLFSGLNKEGYVRRADIGDGHFSLRPSDGEGTSLVAEFTDVVEVMVPAQGDSSQPVQDGPEINTADVDSSAPAPQPPVKTADLSKDEAAAIADGSWKNLKFFAKRSIAAKVSDQAIKDGPDADAAIDAYIAAKKA